MDVTRASGGVVVVVVCGGVVVISGMVISSSWLVDADKLDGGSNRYHFSIEQKIN